MLRASTGPNDSAIFRRTARTVSAGNLPRYVMRGGYRL